ncbi:MAG: type I-E CRISPR-associated protein Cse1/CasA [Bacillota bacterium]|nr:type I-E CRISPR-associated protein Cse1/CasA [Bacillota bacterium]
MNNITFDVLTQPWIPVRMQSGSDKEFGLYELFENAHNIKELLEPSPLIRYGIMRLLVAFVTDVFRPKNRDDLIALIDAGSFDMEKIRRYVSACKNEMGNGCFDLFDDKRPFLQSAYDERYDKNEEKSFWSVATLTKEIPKGNNHIHFVHRIEDEHEYCPAVCARGLCAVNVFALSGGQGYSPGINDLPPWFILVKRSSLFESVLFNTLCEKQIENSELEKNLYNPPVTWRDGTVVVPKQVIPATSYLRGLTWTARRISLLPVARRGICTYSGKESDVLIRKIRYTWGWNSKSLKGRWRDPHVGYCINNKGEVKSIKPSSESSAWRDLGGLVFTEDSVPANVKQCIDIMRKRDEKIRDIELELYSMITEGGNEKVHEWFSETFSLKFEVIDSNYKCREVKTMIQKTEAAADALKKQLNSVFLGMLENKSKSRGKMSEKSIFLSQVQIEFFSQMREYFFDDFLPQLAGVDTEDEDWVPKLHESVNKAIWTRTMSVFNRFSQMLCSDASTITAMVEAENRLRIALSKILPKKEGE